MLFFRLPLLPAARIAPGLLLALLLLLTASAGAAPMACAQQAEGASVVSSTTNGLLANNPPIRVLTTTSPAGQTANPAAPNTDGVTLDALCLLARQLGLKLQFLPDQGQSDDEKLRSIHNGEADLLVRLHTPLPALGAEPAVQPGSLNKLPQSVAIAGLIAALILLLMLLRHRQLLNQLRSHNQLVLDHAAALQTAYKALEKQSHTDELTGLPNRRHFNHHLAREHARRRRNNGSLSLILLDVDHFKAVNDHYGHLAGDKYLQAIAKAMSACVSRQTDLIARYGGEEFACVLPDTPLAGAIIIAERIQRAVANLELPNTLADTAALTVSIGIATLSGTTDLSLQQLVNEADMQLYAAKRAGRNQLLAIELGSNNDEQPQLI